MKTLEILMIILISLIVGLGVGYYFGHKGGWDKANKTMKPSSKITNFDECVKAGYPIMESYPAQCRTSTGDVFTELVK